jgi:signal transduction histidine kinase
MRLMRHVRIKTTDRKRLSDMTHIFTPFFRTTDALRANKGGVGLGLSIARRLTAALGATLGVTSRIGQGSVFSIAFICSEPAK